MLGRKQGTQCQNCDQIEDAIDPNNNAAGAKGFAAFALNKGNNGSDQKQGSEDHHALAQIQRQQLVEGHTSNSKNRGHENTSFLQWGDRMVAVDLSC